MMENIVYLSKYRRMRFESIRSDDELMNIDFDEYGHPFKIHDDSSDDDDECFYDVEEYITDCKDEVKIVLSDHLETLMKMDPAFCRMIGIIPKPIIIK